MPNPRVLHAPRPHQRVVVTVIRTSEADPSPGREQAPPLPLPQPLPLLAETEAEHQPAARQAEEAEEADEGEEGEDGEPHEELTHQHQHSPRWVEQDTEAMAAAAKQQRQRQSEAPPVPLPLPVALDGERHAGGDDGSGMRILDCTGAWVCSCGQRNKYSQPQCGGRKCRVRVCRWA
jgi:hypothetical protein